MNPGELVPTLITLEPGVWFEVYVTHSTAICPSTRVNVPAAGAVIPDGDLRYYPGDQPPAQDYNAYRAAPGGIALLASDPASNDGLRQATRWWLRSDSSYSVEYLLTPMATDSEYQVFAHSKPGFTFAPVNQQRGPLGAAGILLMAQVNPFRKYLGVFNDGPVDLHVTIDDAVTAVTPTATFGILLAPGGSMEWHGSTLQRMRVRAYGAATGQAYVIEGM